MKIKKHFKASTRCANLNEGSNSPPFVWSFVFLPKNLYLLVNWLLDVVVFGVWIWSYTSAAYDPEDWKTVSGSTFTGGNFAHQHVNLLLFRLLLSFFLCVWFFEVILDGGWTAQLVLCEEDCNPIFSHSLFGFTFPLVLGLWLCELELWCAQWSRVKCICGLSVLVC